VREPLASSFRMISHIVLEAVNVPVDSWVGPSSASCALRTIVIGASRFLAGTRSSFAPGLRFVKRIWSERSRIVFPFL